MLNIRNEVAARVDATQIGRRRARRTRLFAAAAAPRTIDAGGTSTRTEKPAQTGRACTGPHTRAPYEKVARQPTNPPAHRPTSPTGHHPTILPPYRPTALSRRPKGPRAIVGSIIALLDLRVSMRRQTRPAKRPDEPKRGTAKGTRDGYRARTALAGDATTAASIGGFVVGILASVGDPSGTLYTIRGRTEGYSLGVRPGELERTGADPREIGGRRRATSIVGAIWKARGGA
ncbi:hypothetical protein KM043_008756 [Ampulex compressa]|nr:hypothetical protein KM043_008756 [Ampulex compressa]